MAQIDLFSEEESDDILLRPTNFSTKETMIKQALTTPKSTINTIQLANEEINEKRGYQDSKISPINEEYEFFDEDFQVVVVAIYLILENNQKFERKVSRVHEK